MAINRDAPEDSVASDDHLLVLLVPAGGIADLDDIKVTELDAATAIDITYSLTPTGYAHTPGEDVREDNRLTLGQALQKAGRQTDTLVLQYVFGAEGEIADAAIVVGEKYIIVTRYAVHHDDALAAGQKVDVLPVVAGRKRKDAPTANGSWTKSQDFRPFDKVRDDAVLSA